MTQVWANFVVAGGGDCSCCGNVSTNCTNDYSSCVTGLTSFSGLLWASASASVSGDATASNNSISYNVSDSGAFDTASCSGIVSINILSPTSVTIDMSYSGDGGVTTAQMDIRGPESCSTSELSYSPNASPNTVVHTISNVGRYYFIAAVASGPDATTASIGVVISVNTNVDICVIPNGPPPFP